MHTHGSRTSPPRVRAAPCPTAPAWPGPVLAASGDGRWLVGVAAAAAGIDALMVRRLDRGASPPLLLEPLAPQRLPALPARPDAPAPHVAFTAWPDRVVVQDHAQLRVYDLLPRPSLRLCVPGYAGYFGVAAVLHLGLQVCDAGRHLATCVNLAPVALRGLVVVQPNGLLHADLCGPQPRVRPLPLMAYDTYFDLAGAWCLRQAGSVGAAAGAEGRRSDVGQAGGVGPPVHAATAEGGPGDTEPRRGAARPADSDGLPARTEPRRGAAGAWCERQGGDATSAGPCGYSGYAADSDSDHDTEDDADSATGAGLRAQRQAERARWAFAALSLESHCALWAPWDCNLATTFGSAPDQAFALCALAAGHVAPDAPIARLVARGGLPQFVGDGSWLAVPGAQALALYDLAGFPPRRFVLAPPADAAASGVSVPCIAADRGRAFACADGALHAWTLSDTQAPRVRLAASHGRVPVAASADGASVLALAPAHAATAAPLAIYAPVGAVHPPVRTALPPAVRAWSFDHDGRLLLTAGCDGVLAAHRLDGQDNDAPRVLGRGMPSWTRLQLSEDGSTLLCANATAAVWVDVEAMNSGDRSRPRHPD